MGVTVQVWGPKESAGCLLSSPLTAFEAGSVPGTGLSFSWLGQKPANPSNPTGSTCLRVEVTNIYRDIQPVTWVLGPKLWSS